MESYYDYNAKSTSYEVIDFEPESEIEVVDAKLEPVLAEKLREYLREMWT
jgi:hypothetical protein